MYASPLPVMVRGEGVGVVVLAGTTEALVAVEPAVDDLKKAVTWSHCKMWSCSMDSCLATDRRAGHVRWAG